MTDTIDREHHRVGAADQTRQQTVTIFDAAVMVKKSGTGPLGDLAQMPDLRRPAANVKRCRVQAGGVLSDSDVASWASKASSSPCSDEICASAACRASCSAPNAIRVSASCRSNFSP